MGVIRPHFLLQEEEFIIIYQNPNNKRPNKPVELVNENIRFPEVLVISPTGEQLGVMKTRTAINLATEQYGLDLFCVNPNGTPPVCKMINYSKFRFESQKKSKEQKKNQKLVELKEIRMSPVIDTHDLETKARKAKEILTDGNKLKVSVRFRGRQMAHIEVGEKILNDFITLVEEYAVIDRKPTLDGRFLTTFLSAKVSKVGGKNNAKDEK